MNPALRSPVSITFAAWKALFLREAVHRLSSGRGAWLWILFEPLSYIVFMLVMFGAFRTRSIGGVDITMWLMLGMLAFFNFRRTALQSMNAIGANRALFAYRQVKPVDTVLVRAGLEGFLMLLVSVILLAGAAMFGHNVMPADPLLALEACASLWVLGLGFGLVFSISTELVPEMARVVDFIMMPMYLISGVMVPVTTIPEPYLDWLLYNPVVHGLEATRLAFSPYYHAVQGLDLYYLHGVSLVTLFFGLALHVRFANRVKMQ